jgi:hypothetical protein
VLDLSKYFHAHCEFRLRIRFETATNAALGKAWQCFATHALVSNASQRSIPFFRLDTMSEEPVLVGLPAAFAADSKVGRWSMSINVRWKSLAAFAAISLALAACGDDKKGDGNGNGGTSGGNDGGANGSNGSTGNNGNTGNTGDGGGNAGDAGDTPLEPGVVGKACTADTDCGASGECRDPLRGGTYADENLGSSGPTGGYCTANCVSDAECGEGGVCFGTGRRGGECRKSCAAAADCERDNYECAKLNNPPLLDEDTGMEVAVPQTCQPLRTPVSFTNEVGNACADDAACNGGTCRGGGQWPGGYCSGSCNADSDCGAEGVCLLRIYGAGGSCYEGCTVDTDCKRDALNYGCVEATGGVTICAFEQDPLPPGTSGKPCAADTDCANGECEDELNNIPAPGGYCTADDCEDDLTCGTGGVCLAEGRGTSCFQGCTADTECRTGYTCTEQGATDKRAKVCFPVSAAGDAGP